MQRIESTENRHEDTGGGQSCRHLAGWGPWLLSHRATLSMGFLTFPVSFLKALGVNPVTDLN